MYRIESHIVEKLKEQGLNALDLLQEQTRQAHRMKCNEIEEVILYATDNLNIVIKLLSGAGMSNEELMKILEDAGIVVER